MRQNLLLLICVFLITGCSVPLVASLEKHSNHYVRPDNLDKALIYVYREGELTGSLRGIYSDINGKRVGALNSGTYFVHEVNPGETIVSLEDRLSKAPKRTFNAEAGKTYYVKGGVKMGLWDAQPYINLVMAEEGQGAIQQLTYATMKAKDLK